MIIVIACCFISLVIGLSLMMSYELRIKAHEFIGNLLPQSKKKLMNARNFAQQMNYATSSKQTQSHWHLQQWWILIAGFFLLSSVLIFAFTRPINPTKVEADYLKKVDPQIYALLNGEVLTAPPTIDESLIDAAITEAIQMEKANSINPQINAPIYTNNKSEAAESHSHYDTAMIDRKWIKMHPRYKQRLLMVFKIMKERHGYEMVLLEGYRSPERQTRLSGNAATTLAKAYQSYHQFGLAADVAFKRNGKVVISERDPWAWQGYKLYGEVAESVGLTWGGRWTKIHDYGHTEFRMPGLRKNRESADQLIAEAQGQEQIMANNTN
ncbi:M15 family metallopeptidase [Acinetobacter sp. ANC 4648]|uniref:M15 family metallopeptidase n=1 Tax=Acinetobacter sp. ANC 4648 TaxID=1977875 RepID=UPI000A34546F|nr:M15 family metallopeptidase [Acinetobacter sp. ANC 4648]OTG85221.1 D-alanyl-D-alanine carboxypeptidase [Acinetobacter sp. ANC 4648]